MTDSITVLAGGWSASQFDLTKLPGKVLGVNDAGIRAPRVDMILSMDRLWAENRWKTLKDQRKPTWLRAGTMGNIDVRGCEEWLTPYRCDISTEMTDVIGRLNGTHSGFCALNLAYQMRPKRIYLVGFDMARGPRGETHWYEQYGWSKQSTGTNRLGEWSKQFEQVQIQLRTANIEAFIAIHKVNRSVARYFTPIRRQELECAK